MRTPARSVVILALLKAAAVAQPDSAAACAACTTTVKQLAVAFSREKKELELSKEANDLKAQKIDKVQKAQTKRWLKNEYNVALRASIEEEMEKVCGRDAITSSRALIGACTKLIEEHEDALPRAILDQKHEGFCAKAVPGCDGEARDKAIAAFQHKGKSEKEPKGKASKVRGVVTRLVGTTFSKGIRAPDQHVLVLLHNGSATKERAYEFSDMRYAALASEFYSLAVGLNTTSGAHVKLAFAQLDLLKNEVPTNAPLADPNGASLVLYLVGDRDEPKSMPELGEKALAFAREPEVRTQLTQFLLTFLPKKEGSALGVVLKEREERMTELLAKNHDSLKAATKAAAARRRAPASAAPPTDPRQPLERCDLCGLIVGKLRRALETTHDELELSKEANERKAQKIDKVQKAQTKRWLKNEYRVALAAALEEALEGVCDEASLLQPVCGDAMAVFNETVATATKTASAKRAAQEFDYLKGGSSDERGSSDKRGSSSSGEGGAGGEGGEGAESLAWPAVKEGKVDVSACLARGKLRCRAVVDEHAEVLMRAVLDDQGLSQCAKLLPRCELPRLQALVEVATALAPAAKDGSGDNAGGGSGAGGDADASPAAPKPKDEL
jgi:hypothetical protein